MLEDSLNNDMFLLVELWRSRKCIKLFVAIMWKKTLANNLLLYFWRMLFRIVVKFDESVTIMATIFWVINFCKCFILTKKRILLYAIYENLNGHFQKDLIDQLVFKIMKNLLKGKSIKRAQFLILTPSFSEFRAPL